MKYPTKRLRPDEHIRRWGLPSAEAIAERDRAMATAHSSYTAEHFGDPRPGRSMLDKKRQQQRAEDL